MTFTPRFKTSVKISTRFSDTDAMGHVNNSRFFSFFEEGRVAYFRRLMNHQGPIADVFRMFPFILASIQCDFLAPVFCGDELEIYLGVTKVGTKSFTIEYDAVRLSDAVPVARGTSALVMYDYKTGKSCAITQDFLDRVRLVDGV